MNRINLIVILICIGKLTFSQAPVGLRHTLDSDFDFDFYVNVTPGKIKYKDTLSYYWFKSQEIHITQGYSSGYPLQGAYIKYYKDGQIAEKGTFKSGLKDGVWNSWYPSGKIKSSYNYKKGILIGNFVVLNEKGIPLQQGVFKKGVLKQEKKKREKTDENKESEEEASDQKEKRFSLKGFFNSADKKDKDEDEISDEKSEKELEKRRKKKEREDRKLEKKKVD